MDGKEAEQYPLFKDYDFGEDLATVNGGTGYLLVPKREKYSIKGYGFGYLALASYIQDLLFDNEKVSLRELLEELKEEGELILSGEPIEEEQSFLERVIKRYEKHGIIKINRTIDGTEFITEEDTISKGTNYDKVKIYKTEQNGDSSLF